MKSTPAISNQKRDDGYASVVDGTLNFYEDNATRYAQLVSGFSMDPELRRFRSYLQPGARVLDVGCGGGRDLVVLKELGLHPIGLDFSPKLAALAAERSGSETIVGDMRDPPFADATFDGIWAAAAILHLDRNELMPTLRQFRRLLAPGGVLFASMKMGRGSERTADGRLFTYVVPEAWTDLLTASGFVAPEVRTEVSEHSNQHSTVWIQSFARAG